MAPPRRAAHVRDDYTVEVGLVALARQASEALIRFDCCGELKDDGHHPMCRRRDETDYEVHPAQETLL